MVSDGNVSGNHVDGDEFVYLDWQLGEQNIDGNYSRINWQVGWVFTTYSCRGLRNGAADIEGVTVYYDFDGGDGVHNYNGSHDHRPKLMTAEGFIYIAHNPDGTRSFSASATMTAFSGLVSSGSNSWDLPTIPRQNAAPSMPAISEITQTAARVQFTDGGGGAPIDSRQISYSTGTDPSAGTIISSDGDDVLTSLTPNTTYHVWARSHNAVGYSDWSAQSNFDTIAGARIKVGGVWKKAVPYTKVSGTWKLARPWTKVLGTWKEDI